MTTHVMIGAAVAADADQHMFFTSGYDGSLMLTLKLARTSPSTHIHDVSVSHEVAQQRAALWSTPANRTLATWIKMLPV